MERLWAPWRGSYVSAVPREHDSCIFCDKPREGRDAENYIVSRGEHVFAILNIYPYNNGHVMVVPYAHVGDLTAVDVPTVGEMMAMAQRCIQGLRLALHPDAFNLGMNLGRSAGAGIADHLHLHVVPRWNGDTNFMPVVADTRVLAQSLDASYQQIRAALEQTEGAR